MAILQVKSTADTRQAEETFASDFTDVNIYRLSFDVLTDAPSVGGKEVLASPDLPARASTYSSYTESDILAWCRRRYAYQNPENRCRWLVVCEFSSEFVDPLNEPPVVRWNSIPAEMAYVIDTAGTRVLNSALDPFDPTPTRVFGYDEITITKNFALDDFVIEDWIDRKWTTNNADFTVPLYNATLGTDECFFRGYGLETFRRNTLDYVRATATIWHRNPTEIRTYPWRDYILDQGFQVLTAGETKEMMLDYYGNPVTRPGLLNGLGARLPLASDPVYLEFIPYSPSDWAPLDIGGA